MKIRKKSKTVWHEFRGILKLWQAESGELKTLLCSALLVFPILSVGLLDFFAMQIALFD